MFGRKYFAVIASCLAMLAFAGTQDLSSSTAAPQSRPAEKYSAKVLNVLGSELSTPRDLYVKIFYYSSTEEIEKYAQILDGKDNQETLRETLRTHHPIGQIQLGNDIAYDVKLVREDPTKNGRKLLIVANRWDFPPRAVELRDPREYPFIVVSFDLDDKNNGKGSFTTAAKLRVNKKRVIEVEDFLVQPAVVNNVRKEVN